MMADKILLAHGSGGKLSHDLIANNLLPALQNSILEKMDDSAVFELQGRLAFTTDSYVVSPIFFPGGDIGKLAVCGTINDLSTSGAKPLYLSLSLIIEEGLTFDDLQRVLASIQKTAAGAGVKIVTGDTKVVNKGSVDRLFINTAGIGIIPEEVAISGSNARPGDSVILSGGIGEHGIAVMSRREGLEFSVPVKSDCAPLNRLVAAMLEVTPDIHCLRDPTRGGLASTLNEIAGQSSVGIRIDEDKIPLKDAVGAACDLLGFEPLYVANEGKLVAVVTPAEAQKVLQRMQRNPYGRNAAIIGEITAEHPGKVVMTTRLGAARIVDMLTGDLLPRIC
ncbi:hydrogenase expression/formation protein HypE [Chloroflexota bacterium]